MISRYMIVWLVLQLVLLGIFMFLTLLPNPLTWPVLVRVVYAILAIVLTVIMGGFYYEESA